jgi:hypothetical protein
MIGYWKIAGGTIRNRSNHWRGERVNIGDALRRALAIEQRKGPSWPGSTAGAVRWQCNYPQPPARATRFAALKFCPQSHPASPS